MEAEIEKINELIAGANSYYGKACELKEIARKSKKGYKIYLDASKVFKMAARICKELASILVNSEYRENYNVTANEFIIFSEYYSFETEQCITSYHYEERDINKAKKHYRNSAEHIEKTINLLNRIERNDFWERKFKVWNYFGKINEKFYDGLLAREAWDKEDYITALDYYRKSIDKQQNIIDMVSKLVEENILYPAYKRIEKSNFIGMMANINASMSQIIYKKNNEGISEDICLELLKLFYKCFTLYKKAYENNPEWDDYKNCSDIYMSNIKKVLEDNKNMWKYVYIDFQSQSGFLNIMKKIDIKTYKEIETEFMIKSNKLFGLWINGSFWISLFIILIFSIAIIAKNISVITLIVALVFCYIFYMIIGAFTLKSIDSLSEEGFLELISIAYKKQIKAIKMINRNTKNQ